MSINKPLKILTYRWQCAHQYELFRLPCEFHLVTNKDVLSWDYFIRPLRGNVFFVPFERINEKDYDLVILPFDENAVCPENSAGLVPVRWGTTFKALAKSLALPMIALCHGAPPYKDENTHPDLVTLDESSRTAIVDFLGDTMVVCNSYEAQKQWSFRRSKAIWHGFNPEEYPTSSYKDGIVYVAAEIRRRPWCYGYDVFKEAVNGFPYHLMGKDIANEFKTISVPLYNATRIVNKIASLAFKNNPARVRNLLNPWAKVVFKNYVDALRRHSIYLNTTIRSPMPRARAEAMLAGLSVVTLPHHDVAMFIKNGENGFIAENAGEMREHLTYLFKHPAEIEKIGKRGQETARREFHIERYLSEWKKLIFDETGKTIE